MFVMNEEGTELVRVNSGRTKAAFEESKQLEEAAARANKEDGGAENEPDRSQGALPRDYKDDRY